MDPSCDLGTPTNSPKLLLEHHFGWTQCTKPNNRAAIVSGRPNGARGITFCAYSAQCFEETTGCRNRCSQSRRNARSHDSGPGYDVSSPTAAGTDSRGRHPSGLCRRLLVLCCDAGTGGSVRTVQSRRVVRRCTNPMPPSPRYFLTPLTSHTHVLFVRGTI